MMRSQVSTYCTLRPDAKKSKVHIAINKIVELKNFYSEKNSITDFIMLIKEEEKSKRAPSGLEHSVISDIHEAFL